MKVEIVLPKAYIDVSIGNAPVGRVVVELYNELAPNTVEKFLKLLPELKNTTFNRVIKNFMIQPQSSASIDHTTIENALAKLDKPFQLCTGAPFFISTYPVAHLEGQHTVFGQVIHGKSVVRSVENVETDAEHVPTAAETAVITACGVWNEGDEVPIFNACYDQIGGDIYEEYPDDDETIDKESSESVFKAALTIKESGGALFKLGELHKAYLKYKKSLRYVTEYVPDEDQEPELNAKYLDLKKKIYLNLSLVCLKLDSYQGCANYSSYLLDLKLTDAEKAKTLYRLGSALIGLKMYKEAVGTLEAANEVINDPAIKREVKRAHDLLDAEKKSERAKYAKFFG